MGKGKSLEFSNFDWHHHAYESYTSSGAMTGGMTLKFSNDPLGSFVKTLDQDGVGVTLTLDRLA